MFNLVPLAWSPGTAGHEVRVACRPDLLDAVTSAGLTAVGVGPGETSKVRRQRDRRRTSDLPPRNGPRSRDSTRCPAYGQTPSG
ncbi:hypothetical protein ACICHK_40695 [Streptomyces sp. AHU1]|uniref:hypothetical protein n=1 Tax=Streptomyces sp. AHU1 TaxID=3377215 RepID=UPI003877E9B5